MRQKERKEQKMIRSLYLRGLLLKKKNYYFVSQGTEKTNLVELSKNKKEKINV